MEGPFHAEKGTITPGKLADLVVLSEDVFTVPPPELSKAESVMTVVAGEIEWQLLWQQ